MRRDFAGLIAPPFTPMRGDGELNLNLIERQYQALLADGVGGAFVCGTSGEGVSLTLEERMAVARRWREVAGEDFLVIVNVGHLCMPDSRALAAHAEQIGADAIAAPPPVYFKPTGVQELVSYCGQIASAAPGLPFYYYHIPALTGVKVKMADFLPPAAERVPGLAGVKFTYEDLMDFGLCLRLAGGRFNMLFGRDEILLAALALGARGAIGTNYNYAAPLFARVMRAFDAGDLAAARDHQHRAMRMISVLHAFGGLPAAKAVMRMLGIDCGPVRAPLQNLSEQQCIELKRRLEQVGFFQWRADTPS